MKRFINKYLALHTPLILLEISFAKMYEVRILYSGINYLRKRIVNSPTHRHKYTPTKISVMCVVKVGKISVGPCPPKWGEDGRIKLPKSEVKASCLLDSRFVPKQHPCR